MRPSAASSSSSLRAIMRTRGARLCWRSRCCPSTRWGDHMTTTRREFLSLTVTAGLGSVTLSMLAPLTRARLPRLRRERMRHLVVLQLSGGNDGLNTVVPFGDDAYYRSRPVLAIRPDAVIKL